MRITASLARGPALDTISGLLGGPLVHDLLRRAAVRAPDRVAIRSGSAALTYGELETAATRFAAGLRAALGTRPAVVALAMTLDPAFAIAYYGISRAGHVSALVNPLLREDGLAHVLGTAGAQALVAPPAVRPKLAVIHPRLPDLRLTVLTEDTGHGMPTMDDLAADAPLTEPMLDEGDLACLQFTSGTTGAPKAVRLTHANLTVNAAQTAYAHQLTGDSVLLNHLPTFHLMHLNIGVTAAATHVLCQEADVVAAVDTARAVRATHFYDLPGRLTLLARDPRLRDLEAPRLRAFLSGGSALPTTTATALGQHFGVPVVQGYGLAETAPSVHLGDLDRPVPGSAGLPVPGGETRIVEIGATTVLPVGGVGEIQVRGPQLMSGYLGRELADDLTADGWFATGDVGRLGEDGSLFVVDRLKDVFKCDNWLVSPSQVERVLSRHPGVVDCVVLDRPDEISGAVAHGLVVARDDTVKPAELAEFVNDQVPYYERLAGVDLVPEIPRSPTGKVRRRDLRDRFLRP
ncbi:class I adenylate-forming enzyme family protein [Amycolatopsis minnesotensis]|uniref:Long-chain fatty acid--CoA ligase n=1 Tax=Amycolatopsis minnesotensis TaxID=337894 RepID=A0ABN2QJI7_9PSEU